MIKGVLAGGRFWDSRTRKWDHFNRSTTAELSGLKLKDLKAKTYLFQAIDRSILETILSKDTSKQIWDSMKKKYQGSSTVKRS
jgi:phosphoenolpyruvate synthase/pyruvate phosphate dikinase